ncbi:MAG: DUF1599 domain-containing protein [Eubacteriales bacterium]|nr:DUF1599 domain-containing protein [Eubacteriales bacterium]
MSDNKKIPREPIGENFENIIDAIQTECRSVFAAKLEDYGPSWLFFRDISMVDQLWIKIRRVRTLEAGDKPAVDEGRDSEFIGIINYAVIMLMKLKWPERYPASDVVLDRPDLAFSAEKAAEDYDLVWEEQKALMERKNRDYSSAWTGMHPFSITDQIVTKIYRIKTILGNGGRLLISENIDAQLMDIINYSVFGLIMARGLI